MNKTNKIIALSMSVAILAELFLVFIIYYNPYKIDPIYDSGLQSTVSGFLNALSAITLIVAYKFIKRKKVTAHIVFIHFALLFSALFLINYIFYHLSVGHVKFTNLELRPLYLIILTTHLLGSVISLPLIFTSYCFGFFNLTEHHKTFAKITFFLWEYVSITGVLIVVFLKLWNL